MAPILLDEGIETTTTLQESTHALARALGFHDNTHIPVRLRRPLFANPASLQQGARYERCGMGRLPGDRSRAEARSLGHHDVAGVVHVLVDLRRHP